jgi:Mn2+/Fe2+ NRAMP family transporter
MVMLADTDAGSVVTASASGARWGYRLLLLQLLLVPVLYAVMRLVVRLSLATGQGLTQILRTQFGTAAAVAAVVALVATALGALVTELVGVAGAGALFGVPRAVSVLTAAAGLLLLVLVGGYRRAEVVGIVLGLGELAFVAAALIAHPSFHAVAAGALAPQPLGDPAYLTLAAANVGAVVMPWMLFFHGSAVARRRPALRPALVDTAIGAVLTQLVMIAVLVVTAATLHGRAHGSLGSVEAIAGALSPYLGATTARLTFALGLVGAAMVASIVVTLAAAWSVAELAGGAGERGSQRRRSVFTGCYAAAVVAGAAIVLASPSLVRISIDAEVLNAALLPLVLGLVVVAARRVLPRPRRSVALRRLAVAAGIVVLGFLPFL